MRRVLQNERGAGSALELGAGNFSNLKEIIGRFETLAGTDLLIDRRSVRDLASEVNVIIADRAACFRESVFDLVFFNPPYLPSGSIQDIATDAGADGAEVPLLFLEEALRVTKDDGKILMLLSSETNVLGIEAFCRRCRLLIRNVGETSLFMETLSVFEIRKKM